VVKLNAFSYSSGQCLIAIGLAVLLMKLDGGKYDRLPVIGALVLVVGSIILVIVGYQQLKDASDLADMIRLQQIQRYLK